MDPKERAEAKRRAIAHAKSALRYERQGAKSKAKAHFGRAMAYYRTGFGTGMKELPPELIDVIVKEAMKSGDIAMSSITEAFLPVIKVDVPVFLDMHPEEMKRDIFYPFYIRAAQAMARRPTIDLLVEVLQYQKRGGVSAGSDTNA